VWALIFVRPALDATAADARRQSRPSMASSAIVRAVASLPDNSVVLSDPATSYLLSAFTTHRFVALFEQHANPLDPLAFDRLEAARAGTSP
jgi:hypothetical protein